MSGFLKTDDVIVTEYTDKDKGRRGRNVEFVPRDIKDLGDKAWESTEYITQTLRVALGPVRDAKGKNGPLKVRDIFLKGCQGPQGPSGYRFPNLRIGNLMQGVTVNQETKESRLWTTVNLEGERPARPTDTPKEPTETPTKVADAAPADVEVL